MPAFFRSQDWLQRGDYREGVSERALLVGRGGQLNRLVAAVSGMSEHGSVFVVVDGPEGVGRTALLDALAERLKAAGVSEATGVSGATGSPRVLQVRGVPWESSIPLGILGQLVFDGEVRALSGAQAATASRIVSSLLEPSEDRSQSTVVLVDDAQDVDPGSLRALATAVRHNRGARLAVICARRQRPAGDAEAHQVLDVAADHRVSMAPLSIASIAELAELRGIALSASSVGELARHTGGLPKHVSALLDELPREVWRGVRPQLPPPGFVDETVRAGLAECDTLARRLVQTIAVLGSAQPLPIVCSIANIEDPWTAIDAAERRDLVTVQHNSSAVVLDAPDPMVRAAILATMSRSLRAQLHREAALVLTDRADVLTHVAAADPLPGAEMSEQLADLAGERSARGQWATAAQLFELSSRTAVEPTCRDDMIIRAVDALIGAGDVRTAAGHIAEIESLRETPMRNSVLGYLAILRGRPHEADARLARAWQLVRIEHEPEIAAVICHRQVLHNLARCDGAALVEWADRAVELVGADHATAVEAQAIRGLGLGGTGRVAEALESYRDLWGHAGTGAVGQRVQMGAGWLHLATDHVELARAELESASRTDFLGGSTRISLWALAWLARTYFATGDWDAALRTVGDGAELVDRSGAALIVPLLQWTATQIHALRGDWELAVNSARRGDAGARDYEIMRVPAALAHAAVAEARADYSAVLRALAPLTDPWARNDVSEPGFWPWADVYANALVVEGRLQEAGEFLAEHEERVAARGHKSGAARLACARGRLHGALGDLESARASFDYALALLAPLPLVYDRARVNFAYGQTLRRAGKRREADSLISAARDGYLSIGATAYVRRCDRELKAGGVHAVLKDRASDTLTPQEEAVAGLVATGMTNREVAAELFLSVKTVQFHLTRVYAKLGIRSRAELAAAKGRE